MPNASPNPARGQQPGKYQRPKLRPVTFRRVALVTGEDEPTFYWNEDGTLYLDYELTEPAGLTIVELVE